MNRGSKVETLGVFIVGIWILATVIKIHDEVVSIKDIQNVHTETLLVLLKDHVKDMVSETDDIIPQINEDDKKSVDGMGYEAKYHWFNREHKNLLGAISMVESSNRADAVGDNGKALGMYQIWEPYWADAIEHDNSIGGTYNDVFDPTYAEKIVLAYWDRYGKRYNYDIESLARIHNGGPRGPEKKTTDLYWNKVKKLLD